jgi:signal transduction histidine kinase
MQSNVKFLLTDDLESNLLALEGLLRRDGLELLKARSGAEALEMLLVHDIALAILDVQMPGMDGFELAELMRGTERTRRVPIIFVTAGAVDSQRRFRGYETGAVDFLFKPIEPHILKSKTDVFFELARQRDALQRSVEAAEAASRAKDDFLAALSHELRTPLAPVLLSAGTLESDPALPEFAREQMRMIRRNIELEARLIDDLLDLTRISRGKLPFHPVLADAHALLRHTEEIVRSELPAAVTLALKLEAGEHQLMADPARLQQVFWNLMKNAVKFTESGGSVSVRTFNQSPGRLSVEVRDTGIGIAPSALDRIFRPFDQGELGSRHRFGGLGLGLSISKAVVDQHGGELVAASEGLGRGATFTLHLPVVRPVVPALRAGPQPAELKRPLRLLVAEDHDFTRAAMVRLLENDGHRVLAASSVDEALAIAQVQPFDILISDISLSDGSGLELMRELKRRHGSPGIALSGCGMDKDVRDSLSAGFSTHLVKPVDVEELRTAIVAALKA